MKFKHKKKRNTAFLYEALILELTKSVVAKNKQLTKQLFETLKKYFHKDCVLGKELQIFKSIESTKNVNELIAEKILQESKKLHNSVDINDILEEQNKLFLEIKKLLGDKQLFSNFVPNYKDLASISQIFNKDVSVKTRVLLENDIVNKMIKNNVQENKMVPIDNIVLNSFIKKFNEKYQPLREEQKKLLNKYISSFADNGLDFKIFLNEEIKRLKTGINKNLGIKEFIEDPSMMDNAKKVLEILDSFSKQTINEQMIQQVLKIQDLVEEINK